MFLFSVGQRVWALRSIDSDPELGVVIARQDYTYTIRAEHDGHEFTCIQSRMSYAAKTDRQD